MSSRQTIINIYIILYNVIDFKEFPMQTYVPFHVVPFLIGFHFTLHHISMSWSLSLQVSLFCKLILLYIPLKAPMFFLQLNSFVHLFHICVETNFINWPTDHGFNQLVHIILADACVRSSWLRRIKYKTAWCAYRVAIPNCSPRDEVLIWILWQHFLLFWCQVSDKFHMSKTFKLGFWLYYILFILRVLNQLIQFLIADARSVVFLWVSLCNGLNISGSNLVVILLSKSTVMDLLMISCSPSSLALIMNLVVNPLYLQDLQFLQLLHR